MRKLLLALILSALPFAPASADELKLGFISILSGQLSLLGQELKRGFDLAVEELGGKVGGVETKIFVADNKGNPADAVQEANKLIDRDKVDVVTGFLASHTTMAALKPLLANGVIALGANAGPSPLAGKGCNKNWFSTAFHNDQWDMAMGQYMTQKGLKRVYFMGMDYQAGWDHVKAAIREFKGEKVAEVYTPISQLDFSAELTQLRAAKPDAVFVFYVGPLAVAFLKQYTQAGLNKTIPLYSMGAISDPLLYKAEGDAALGLVTIRGLEHRARQSGQQEVRRRIQQEIRPRPDRLCGAPVRRRHAARCRGPAGQGQGRRQGRAPCRHPQGRFPVGARRLPLQQQPVSDPERLHSGGLEAAGRRDVPEADRHRHEGHQGSGLRRLQDVVGAGRPGAGRRNASRPFASGPRPPKAR